MKCTDYDYCDRNDYNDKNEDTKEVGRFTEVDKICIGCPKPCITSILEGSVKVELKKTKIIKNCEGFRLLVEGCKYIKISYCSNDCCAVNKVFTDTFVVPFSHFIDFCGCYRDLRHVDIDVYKCSVEKISSKCAVVRSKIRVEPIFKEIEYEDWDCDWDCNCKVKSDCNSCHR
jgi:hypothetical protein